MPLLRKNYSTKTDEELMLLLAKGGQRAFDELYGRYAKPMLNFFFRMLNNDREKAEDLLHDLFLKIIEKPELFDCTKKFSTWFYTLAGNMIKNEYRSQQVKNAHEQESLYMYNEIIEPESGSIDQKIFDSRLQKELEKLDPELKTIFNLRFIEEMNIKQIADMVGCPEGTVKSRLFHLTRQLSKKLVMYKPEKTKTQ